MPVANPDRQSGGGSLSWLTGYLNPPPAPAKPPAPQPTPQQPVAGNPFQTDPGYLAALANEQAGIQAADAALRAAQEQAIVGFGDPSIARALGFDVSEQTGQAASANPNSTVKRLGEQRDLNQRGIINSLAAHGILFSGDLGYRTGENEKAYGRSVYDAGQELLAGLNGLGRDTARQKQDLRSKTTDALMGAYDRMVANPGMWGAAGPQTAAPPPLTQALTAKPIRGYVPMSAKYPTPRSILNL